jgi:hypothetical protein
MNSENLKATEDRLAVLEAKVELIKSGFAGVTPDGVIVDRRTFPDAIPVQANSLLGTPAPEDVLGGKVIVIGESSEAALNPLSLEAIQRAAYQVGATPPPPDPPKKSVRVNLRKIAQKSLERIAKDYDAGELPQGEETDRFVAAVKAEILRRRSIRSISNHRAGDRSHKSKRKGRNR